jgi:hypothetical protein
MATRKMLGLTGAIFAFAVQPVAAAPAATHTFEGSCAVIGVATVERPVTLVPSPNRVVYRATGTCNGTLDGRRLPATGAPVAYVASGDKITSCTSTLVRLTAALRFYPRRGRAARVIRLAGEIVIAGRNGGGPFRGAQSGTATATVTVQGGPEALEACAAGAVTHTVMSGELLTFGPIVG